MATSPNYGWLEPDNTDLVKNGALSIRTLGNAIDTTMATMTPKSTYTAKGSIAAATAASTPANLSVGNNGETLVADSSTSTGLSYQANWAAGKNKIINGDYRINQRGFSSVTANDTYTFDRWRTLSGGTVTYAFTPQTFTPGTAPVAGYEGSTFLQCAISAATSSYIGISQRIEDVRTFANQSIVVSFWAKAASGTPSVDVVVNQDFGSGGSGSVNTIGTKQAISTSWTRYSFKITVPSISGKTIGTSSFTNVYLLFSDAIIGSGVGDQTGTFQIWGFQAEAGSVATAFQTATGTLQGELSACQRYYQRFTNIGTGDYNQNGIAYSGTKALIPLKLTTSMRSAVTAIDYSSLRLFDYVNAALLITNLIINTATSDSSVVCVEATVASGLTQYRTYVILGNTLPSYLGLSAEL